MGTKSPGFHQKVSYPRSRICMPPHPATIPRPFGFVQKAQDPTSTGAATNPWENFKPQIVQPMSELKDLDPSSRGNLVPYTLKAEAGARRRRSEPQLYHFLLDNSQAS